MNDLTPDELVHIKLGTITAAMGYYASTHLGSMANKHYWCRRQWRLCMVNELLAWDNRVFFRRGDVTVANVEPGHGMTKDDGYLYAYSMRGGMVTLVPKKSADMLESTGSPCASGGSDPCVFIPDGLSEAKQGEILSNSSIAVVDGAGQPARLQAYMIADAIGGRHRIDVARTLRTS